MTLDKDTLKNILRNFKINLNENYIDELLTIAFPPKLAPKGGEVIWVKTHENDTYRLRVFSHINNEERYVVFAEGIAGREVTYKIAMSQTHVEKGL